MKKSIFAGMLIALSGIGYLAVGGIIGAILFTFGLLCIVMFDCPLYTGVAGNIDYRPPFTKTGFKELGNVLFGNIIGCFLIAIISKWSDFSLKDAAGILIECKMVCGFWSVFCKAVLCGFIIDVAVWLYKKQKTIFPILFGVPLFILIGGNHSIADTFYILCMPIDSMTWKILVFYPLVILGNFIGCNIRKIILG